MRGTRGVSTLGEVVGWGVPGGVYRGERGVLGVGGHCSVVEGVG